MKKTEEKQEKRLALKTVTIKSLAEIKGGSLTRTWSYKGIHSVQSEEAK